MLVELAAVVGDGAFAAFVVQLAEDAADAFGVGRIGLDDEGAVEPRGGENGLGSEGGDQSAYGSLAVVLLGTGGYVDAVLGQVVQAGSDLAEAGDESSVVGAEA